MSASATCTHGRTGPCLDCALPVEVVPRHLLEPPPVTTLASTTHPDTPDLATAAYLLGRYDRRQDADTRPSYPGAPMTPRTTDPDVGRLEERLRRLASEMDANPTLPLLPRDAELLRDAADALVGFHIPETGRSPEEHRLRELAQYATVEYGGVRLCSVRDTELLRAADALAALTERVERAERERDPSDDPCADALDKLWRDVILAHRPNYGDWEYPGQAYRHLLAEFNDLRALVERQRAALEDLLRDVVTYEDRAESEEESLRWAYVSGTLGEILADAPRLEESDGNE